MLILSEEDLKQVDERGTDPTLVEEQVEYFVNGFPFLHLAKAATVGEGILRLSKEKTEEEVRLFDRQVDEDDLTLLKFVPASGAATRMFKSLFAFLEEGKSDKSVEEFFDNLEKFAFYKDLKDIMTADSYDVATADRTAIADYFLTEKGLGYGNLPKGLLKFHTYPGGARTPLEEHLVEGARYANANGRVQLHFTVSPEHRDRFEKLVVEALPTYESAYGVKYFVSFSEQKASTDTIAVNMDNTPFREKDGSILFRPAGHGALLENLSVLEADVIFIKNVDNVVPDHLKEETVTFKKALAGILLDYRAAIYSYLDRLDASIDAGLLDDLDNFFQKELCVAPPAEFGSWNEEKKADYFRQKLDRPLRVCGMVKNVGEPGGGPFWARNADGSSSLQIVESAQVDMDDAGQQDIFQNATHFNPVDLICSMRNRHGDTYALRDFRDPKTGFVSKKSKDGQELKAQELPGLWNGAMADWNTLFVEVPMITFNPVKTVNDLLREQHQ